MNCKTTNIHDDVAHRYAIFLCSQIAKGQCKDYLVGQPSTDGGHISNDVVGRWCKRKLFKSC